MKAYTVTITRGGQLTIPAAIRQALELKVGDTLEVYEVDEEREVAKQ
jgi:AbrB family looped-hinge helix DNA binding protein